MPPKRKATGKAKAKGKEAAPAPPGKKAKRATAANSATPSIRDMEGRVIRKEFDGVWFDGTITKVYAKDEQVRVVYSDGDTEDLELHECTAALWARGPRRDFSRARFLARIDLASFVLGPPRGLDG